MKDMNGDIKDAIQNVLVKLNMCYVGCVWS